MADCTKPSVHEIIEFTIADLRISKSVFNKKKITMICSACVSVYNGFALLRQSSAYKTCRKVSVPFALLMVSCGCAIQSILRAEI